MEKKIFAGFKAIADSYESGNFATFNAKRTSFKNECMRLVKSYIDKFMKDKSLKEKSKAYAYIEKYADDDEDHALYCIRIANGESYKD